MLKSARAATNSAISDLKSFNGTLVNNQRISESAPLFDGDEIQLGAGGPLLRLSDPHIRRPRIAQSSLERRRRARTGNSAGLRSDCGDGSGRNNCFDFRDPATSGAAGRFAAAIAGSTLVRVRGRNFRSVARLTTICGSTDYRFRIITRGLCARTAAFQSRTPDRPTASTSTANESAAGAPSSFPMSFKSDRSCCRPMRAGRRGL